MGFHTCSGHIFLWIAVVAAVSSQGEVPRQKWENKKIEAGEFPEFPKLPDSTDHGCLHELYLKCVDVKEKRPSAQEVVGTLDSIHLKFSEEHPGQPRLLKWENLL